MSRIPENVPTYWDNIGIFIKSEHPFLKNTWVTTNIKNGVTTLPVGTLIQLTQGEVKRVVSPFNVLVTWFSGEAMHILYWVKNRFGEHILEWTVKF